MDCERGMSDAVRVRIGDCRAVLATLEPDSVQCVVTSPPYWGLRDYGVDGQLGLEPTPEESVANLVGVLRQVRRVLREDGVVWLNLGDSYNAGTTAPSRPSLTADVAATLKPKDLVGIPWRVAFALQADGWYLRADVIWAKPNPMPESVTDRPTKAHEYVFLLTKSERYFYDGEAIKERRADLREHDGHLGDRERNVGGRTDGYTKPRRLEMLYTGRNRRSVWTIATEPYPEAHFATFPRDLVAPCILAGTSERGCCAQCGAPWGRVVAAENRTRTRPGTGLGQDCDRGTQGRAGELLTTTLGWAPACRCDAAVVPCTVLDPFAGSGTTVYVAQEYGRRAIGIELNPVYVALAERRLRQGVLPLWRGGLASTNGHARGQEVFVL